MIPEIWARTIAGYLEQRGVVGALQPDDGSDANDRFVPRRVDVDYVWRGDSTAQTEIRFKVKTAPNRNFVNEVNDNYSVVTSLSDDWGAEWENVTITIPAAINLNVEIHEISRFRIRIFREDTAREGENYIRHISVENLNQRGIIHAIRIFETNLPEIIPLRNSGLEEDRYYRARGLIGFLNQERALFEFSPFAIIPERARRPAIGPTIAEVIEAGILSHQTARLFTSKGYQNLFEFQADSITRIRDWLNQGSQGSAILLTVGTAAGKTEAFGMPLLDRFTEDRPYFGTQGLFVYPTKSLQTDQTRRFFEYLAIFNEGRENPVSIGYLNGDLPKTIGDVSQQERRGEFRSPFAHCPVQDCTGILRFAVNENNNDMRIEDPPYCPECRRTYPWIRFYRDQIESARFTKPPNILLIIPDLLYRLISNNMAWSSQVLLGRPVHVCTACGHYRPSSTSTLRGGESCKACGESLPESISIAPSLIVFDEAHYFKGVFGSNVALMIARIRQIAERYGHRPVFVGASATIANPEEFGTQLFGGNVEVLAGREEPSDEEPTRYHLFFMPVKVSTLNAVGHTLTGCFVADADNNEVNRILLFSDSKRTVYQLEMTLPTFYATEANTFVEGLFYRTASHTGDLGYEERQRIELGFDRGDFRVLLATQTLEVGVDFNNLQLEIQTGATYSYNDYIQRVGRAGRRGVPALVICILRPQVPLDYYYYEHCKELTQFSEETLDDVPLRSDNFFLIGEQVPAAIQDFLINREDGARLMWHIREASNVLSTRTAEVEQYLYDIFLRDDALEPDLIRAEIQRKVVEITAALRDAEAGFTNPTLSSRIKLAIRNTDVQISVQSDDFDQHWGISLAREIDDENNDLDVEIDLVDMGGAD